MWTIATQSPIQIVVIQIQGLQVSADRTAFEKLRQCAQGYAEKYAGRPIGQVDGVQFARRLFHAIGIDPTRHRPSSEALLNRALKGKAFYSVSSLVDVGNWCSLEFLLPICIHDADKIQGPVTIRTGLAHESYPAFNGQEINLDGRYVIADALGPFGSPIKDSQRTAVTEQTRQAVLVLFASSDYDRERLLQQANLMIERIRKFCGGQLVDLELLVPGD